MNIYNMSIQIWIYEPYCQLGFSTVQRLFVTFTNELYIEQIRFLKMYSHIYTGQKLEFFLQK